MKLGNRLINKKKIFQRKNRAASQGKIAASHKKSRVQPLFRALDHITMILNYFKLKNILLTSFLLIFLIPFVLILFFSVSSSKEILSRELAEAVYSGTQSTTQIVSGKVESISSIMTEILTDTEFEEHMTTINQDRMNINSHNWLLSRMRSFRAKAISDELEAIIVTTADGEKHYGELIKTPFYSSPFNGSEIQSIIDASEDTIIFPMEYNQENYLVFGYKTNHMYIHIYKKASTLQSLYQNANAREGTIFLVDQEGIPLVSAQELDTASIFQAIQGKDSGYLIHPIEGEDHIISFDKITETDFQLISVNTLTGIYDKINATTIELLKIAFVLLLLVVIVSYIISKLIASPVVTLEKLMKIAEGGDLKVESTLKGKSELVSLSQSFNGMIKEFSGLVKEINEGAHVLNRQTEKIEGISNQSKNNAEHVLTAYGQLAQTIEGQARDSSQSFEGVKELEKKIRNVIEYTAVIQKDIYNMVHTIEAGSQNVEHLVAFTQETGDSYEQVLTSMTELRNQTSHVQKVINLIEEAAERSNLLALNATIEAARAGAEGRGFAVVANEMGALSVGIKQSTQEIKTIITHLMKQIKDVHVQSEASNVLLKKQVNHVNLTSQVFHQINSLSDVCIHNVSGIDQVMEEMNQCNGQTYQMIQNISCSAEETTSTSEEILKSTNSSLGLSQELYDHVAQLQVFSKGLVDSVNKFLV